jgi:hypothetical protein
MGRASRELGNTQQAKKQIEDAIAHLSNTVDADHPALIQARELLSTL